jgi:hypothetical protein
MIEGMDTNDNMAGVFSAVKPQYIVFARQSPDSDFMVTVGAGWKFEDGIVLRLDLVPTKWDGVVLLRRAT